MKHVFFFMRKPEGRKEKAKNTAVAVTRTVYIG
jgi:hypothetical protein